MILDGICIIQGPGDLGLYEDAGILYIYTKDKIGEVPDKGRIYTIEEGFNRFYLGEPEPVRKAVYHQTHPKEFEVEL